MFVFIWGIFLETIWKSSAMANISSWWKKNTIAVKLRKICTQTQNWGFDAAVIDHRLFSKCHLQTIISPRKGLTDAKVVTFFWDLRKLHLWCHEFCELGILQRILDDSHAPTHLLAHLPSFDLTVSQHHDWTHLAYVDGWHCWELDGEKTLPWNIWFAEVGIFHLCSTILQQTFLLSMGDFWTCYSLRLKFESRCPPKCMSRQTTRSGISCESLTDIFFYQVACKVVLTKSDVFHLRIVEKAPKQVDVR